LIDGRDIICFGDEEWLFPGSLQRLLRGLAVKNRVTYITSLGVRTPHPSLKDITKAVSRVRRWFQHKPRRTADPVRVITPAAIPLYDSLAITRLSGRLVYEQLRRAGVFPPPNSAVVMTALPTAGPVLEHLHDVPVIFYSTDKQSAYAGANRRVLETLERELALRARFCVATAENVACELRAYNPNTYWIDHGIDFEMFQRGQGPLPADIAGLRRPIVGFVGGLTHWVDRAPILALARQRPDLSIVLVGKIYNDWSDVVSLPNVHWLGPKPYSEMPAYIASFDVCLLPFHVGDWEIHANPLKTLEYFACGKPIVTSSLPNVTRYGELVYPYHSPAEVAERVADALAEPQSRRQMRIEIARTKAHPHEVEEFCACVERHIP
jgi:glycosyltransferase involved in cell wall biosynthesis